MATRALRAFWRGSGLWTASPDAAARARDLAPGGGDLRALIAGVMPVHAQLAEGILHLTLDRPNRRNAMDLAMWHALRDHAREVGNKVRAVVISGAGEHFCAGMDLSAENPLLARAAPAVFKGDDDVARTLIRELKDCLAAVAELPCPSFAAIEGACLGGGYEVALACDVRIAARTASLGLPEIRVGMIPDCGGTARLTRLVGPGRAADLITTARRVNGEEAFQLGMVERVVDGGHALAAAMDAARDVARNAPEATRLALSVVRNAADLGLDEALALETQAGVFALTSGEAREGLAAFAEKRAPRWS